MRKTLIVPFVLLAWAAAANVVAEPVDLLVYKVWERGIDPYINRIMVTEDHIRLDEGDDAGAYTLYDRDQEIIYNVSHEDRSVLVINPTAFLPESADSLILGEQVQTDADAPTVAGQVPRRVRLLANGEVCSELVAVEGVMQEAVDALSELKLTLARAQVASLAVTPLELQTPCELASSVYAADRVYRFGLPLQERGAGRSQSLRDFVSGFEVADDLFRIPEDYSRQTMFSSEAI
ncbi:MAG: hypothetical protein KDI88_12675 [Gammaproteobacteria bacterium]|nr:hypothetical protein [Gammaproteobacteria bacterium]